MAQFKKGDTVSLKSGGPVMTIVELITNEDGQEAKCMWFDRNQPLDDYFDVETLKPADNSVRVSTLERG